VSLLQVQNWQYAFFLSSSSSSSLHGISKDVYSVLTFFFHPFGFEVLTAVTLKGTILWHVDPMLGNDNEISDYTATVAN
jgi:hypothetical protein